MTSSLTPFERNVHVHYYLARAVHLNHTAILKTYHPYILHTTCTNQINFLSTCESLPRVPRTKCDFNILTLDACWANIIRSKEASLGMSLLPLVPNIGPVCKALPAELMVTLGAYQKYSAIGPRD
jgi:hypothetical protein